MIYFFNSNEISFIYPIWRYLSSVCKHWTFMISNVVARRDGAEVAGWTLDRKIRVRFPPYPHRVWALWWQGDRRRPRMSRCPCRGRLGTLKTPSCPSRWVPGSRSKCVNWTSVPSLYSWNIAECDVKPQSSTTTTTSSSNFVYYATMFPTRKQSYLHLYHWDLSPLRNPTSWTGCT